MICVPAHIAVVGSLGGLARLDYAEKDRYLTGSVHGIETMIMIFTCGWRERRMLRLLLMAIGASSKIRSRELGCGWGIVIPSQCSE